MKNINFSSIVRSPHFWIATQLLAIMVVGNAFECWSVQMHADSPSYINASKLTLLPALSQNRTLGYPMILRLVAMFSSDYSAIPWVQLAMLWAAVFLFDFAVRRFGAMPWQAFAVSSGFMYGAIQQVWTIASVLTDFPAIVVANITIACLLLVVAIPRHLGAWLGLTFFLGVLSAGMHKWGGCGTRAKIMDSRCGGLHYKISYAGFNKCRQMAFEQDGWNTGCFRILQGV